jgi:hypothetical protein
VLNNLFDISWVDVNTPGDDYVFLAIQKKKEAILIDVADITRMQPPIDDSLRCCGR